MGIRRQHSAARRPERLTRLVAIASSAALYVAPGFAAAVGPEPRDPRLDHRRPDAAPIGFEGPRSVALVELGRMLFFEPRLSRSR